MSTTQQPILKGVANASLNTIKDSDLNVNQFNDTSTKMNIEGEINLNNNANNETKNQKRKKRKRKRRRRKKNQEKQLEVETESNEVEKKENKKIEENNKKDKKVNKIEEEKGEDLTETEDSSVKSKNKNKTSEFGKAKILNLGSNSSESEDSESETGALKKKNRKKVRDKHFNDFVEFGNEIILKIFFDENISSFNDSVNISQTSSILVEECRDPLDFSTPQNPQKAFRKLSCVDFRTQNKKAFEKRRGSMVINLENSDELNMRTSSINQLEITQNAQFRVNWRKKLENKNRKDKKKENLKLLIDEVYRRLAVNWSLREIRWWNDQLESHLRKLLSTTPNKLKVIIRIFFETFDEIFPKTGGKAAEVLRVFVRLINDVKDVSVFDNVLVKVQKIYHFMPVLVKNQIQKMLRSEIKIGKKQKEKRAKLDSLVTPMFQKGKNAKKKLKFVFEMSNKADHFSISDLTRRYPLMVSGGAKEEKRFFKALNSKWNREMDNFIKKKNKILENKNKIENGTINSDIFVIKPFNKSFDSSSQKVSFDKINENSKLNEKKIENKMVINVENNELKKINLKENS